MQKLKYICSEKPNGMRFLIGIDDTDNKESRGTGFKARKLGNLLQNNLGLQVNGITRHQLFIHKSIAYTSQNSAACLDVDFEGTRKQLIEFCENYIINEAAPGSDAGLCVVYWHRVNEELMDWGLNAKKKVLKLNDALELAQKHHYFLQGYTGEKIGQIGAFAAVGLRKTGDDGRFIWLKGIQELRDFDQGVYLVKELFEKAGIEKIESMDGVKVGDQETLFCNGWTRPVLKNQQSVLIVEKSNLENYDWKTVGKDYIRSIS